MTLLICPVRPGDDNPELRFALRSWETHLILPTGLSLMTVGYKPSWLEPDIHVDGNRYSSMPHAVFDNVRLGAEAAVNMAVHDVIYMNDDFFCLDPVGAILPVRRNISLAEHVAMLPAASSWWSVSLRLTASWLSEQGFPHPDSFEVHRPLPAGSLYMADVLDRWPFDPNKAVPQWRTLYGVLNEVEAHPVQDAKLGGSNTGVGTPWISTSDQSWRRYAPRIKRRFQKPSRWEKN